MKTDIKNKSDMINRIKYGFCVITILLFTLANFSCKKFLEVNPPIDRIVDRSVYKNSSTAIAALLGVYSDLSNDESLTHGSSSIGVLTGLGSDELSLVDESNNFYGPLYNNALLSQTAPNIWVQLYFKIYMVNSIIDGVTASQSIPDNSKSLILGEAKFLRAFLYFYLLNFYGDVPLVLGIDYKKNSTLPRSPSDAVYSQIVSDLKEAKRDLNDKYLASDFVSVTVDRVRPNRFAACALLARVYLYQKQYDLAISESSEVISNTTNYALTDVTETFLANSKEAIWQIKPNDGHFNSRDGSFYIPNASSEQAIHLSPYILKSFEEGDKRKEKWIKDQVFNPLINDYEKVMPYPAKYNEKYDQGSPTEYTMILRLAEQYLIRAEAKIKIGDIVGGIEDLNKLRFRSRELPSILIPNPLPDLPLNLSEAKALEKVVAERRVELFSEWGHRWFDLKRLNLISDVLKTVTPEKGGLYWNINQSLYPIPLGEFRLNPSLRGHQNPGYSEAYN